MSTICTLQLAVCWICDDISSNTGVHSFTQLFPLLSFPSWILQVSIFLILNGVWMDTCIFWVSDLNSFHNKLCIDILFYPWNDIKKRHLNHYDKLRKLKEIPERFSTVKVFWSVPVFVPLFYWWIIRSYFSLYQACAFLHTANISSVGRGGKYIFS